LEELSEMKGISGIQDVDEYISRTKNLWYYCFNSEVKDTS
jgi:hypothetical protein